jgi:threonine synthase
MIGLICTVCRKNYPVEPLYECKSCGGILEVEYDYDQIHNKWMVGGENLDDLLPIPSSKRITIGEGNTPLIKSERLAKRLGILNLYLKCEFSNPSGAFKDRPVSMGVSMARRFGYDRIIVASSGNGAAATAAFAARAGLEAVILVPENTPQEKVKQSLAYGAKVVRVEGPYSNSFALAKEIGEKFDMFNVTSTFINPYTVEGDKTVAFEMYRQLDVVPNIIYVPIGAGPLLVGIFKGYEELEKLHKVNKLPRMAGIQAEGCSPIARAYLNGQDGVISDPNPNTIAGGICDGLYGYAKDGTYTLEVIKRSGGFANYVTDEEIQEAQSWLAKDEGLFVEPSSAVSIAELKKSLTSGNIQPTSVVVAILTGHGLKDMKQVKVDFNAPILPNDAQAVADWLNSKG